MPCNYHVHMYICTYICTCVNSVCTVFSFHLRMKDQELNALSKKLEDVQTLLDVRVQVIFRVISRTHLSCLIIILLTCIYNSHMRAYG